MYLRRLAITMFVGIGGCFDEAQGVTTVSSSDGSGGASTGGEGSGSEGSTSSTTEAATGSGSSGEVADSSTTAAVCEDASLDVAADPVPTQLIVLALAGIDPTAFNQAIAPLELQALVDAEGTRVVFLDLGVGLATFADACDGCESGTCTHVVHRMLDVGAPALTAIQDAPQYSCVLWPEADSPRKRVLLLSPGDDPPVGLANFLLGLVDGGWDVDLACPGCGETTGGPFAPLVREAGGIISDLSSPDAMGVALTLGLAAPPACGWATADELPAPHTLADLRLSIDPCSLDESSCVLSLAQVEGLADCDANDPDANEFYVLENAVSEGVSLVGLCEPACVLLRRATAFGTAITRDFVCP
ncbi:MAG: hypothetical protein IPK74_13745 [Deltaproteobacteria bacterium]|nr:hypothetical protein [Deltaproteobacteria bacterium]